MEVLGRTLESGPQSTLASLLENSLLVDLEVSQAGRILRIGAVLGSRTLACQGSGVEGSLRELGVLAGAARYVLGHNLVRHDLRVLRETAAWHPILRLPVIDTLVLSPLAFPENPYHRLVKDYKLVRESMSDPVADARQAAKLFGDEFNSFAGLKQTEPSLFELLHFLLGTADSDNDTLARGMELLFVALGGVRPSRARALSICRSLVGKWGCASVLPNPALFDSAGGRSALAYAVTWLRVAGANSVLPLWVRLEHPLAIDLIRQLREVPCTATGCAYCRQVHDSRKQLQKFFGFDDFRCSPPNATGGSMQREIVDAAMREESFLAILPTGSGKSVCYQLPALVRNHRRGVLTIVISPLQALMKDQVDGLARRTGASFGAALCGLLTPPERGNVLRRVRMGDVAVLYISPEQLRNRSFRAAIAQREIGCWVFDEAHCLSKWGHDFRPDYLYAGRFIREFSAAQGGVVPPIECFTATAKRDVKEEILRFFLDETGRDLRVFEGGFERDNLMFEVQTVPIHAKLERVHDLLSERLPAGRAGSAIVFRATREAAMVTAAFLQKKGWQADHFHAGLTPVEKRRVQDEFLVGSLRVICATNAFGMGIDKDDVRLVIHADTPGSLENYLQEAGRAGRDGLRAECVLLMNDEDVEQQFRIGAFSELSRHDIAQILRALRKAGRGRRDEIVVTAGEILRDEDVDTAISLQDRGADTKVRTAISWLERAGFLERDENVTQVFQARPLVRSIKEAEARMAPLNLHPNEKERWIAVLGELMNADPDQSLTIDQLALLPQFENLECENRSPDRVRSYEYISARIFRLLRSMTQAGLLKCDTLLNAFVRHNVPDHSKTRLDRVLALERKLVDLLATEEPDPEGWLPLSLRFLNTRLCEEGFESSIGLLSGLLRSMSEDGRGFAGTHGSIDIAHASRDSCRVRVRRSWQEIEKLAEKRRRVAALVLEVLRSKISPGTPGRADLLVSFSFEELRDAVDGDLILRSDIKDIDAALERALMYLHEQRVIVLQHGLAVFRSAMSIRLKPEARSEPYAMRHYLPLAHHYRERVFQVHVMSEFARRGSQRIAEALRLVLAYFTLDKEEFIKSFLGDKPRLLKYAATAQSFQRIVTDLNNPAQARIVTAPPDRNILILAGPGSGKTRTVVHRCAWLLRFVRARPSSILICCFNRSAALEVRRRLIDLVGTDARGVTVLTYHALALRLLGQSFAARALSRREEPDFDALIVEATRVLRGEKPPPGLDADEVRDKLLAGFRHILVDEYQDIDAPQYDLISAIAGRTLDDADQRLSILAVGDDDQNIYAFRGANVEFIRRFRLDYGAEVHCLIENYRSTGYIIGAANRLVSQNLDRMKSDKPIQIDRRRRALPPGGDLGLADTSTGGKVQIISVHNDIHQAQAVVAEIKRLRSLGVSNWSAFAVLSRTHRELALVRAAAETAQMPIRWCAERSGLPALHQIREIRSFVRCCQEKRCALARASTLRDWALTMPRHNPGNPWTQFLLDTIDAWQAESADAELPMQDSIEFIYETCAESRLNLTFGRGVTFATVHGAKGTEFDHVLLIGGWPIGGPQNKQEELRRVFYVGMTRARHSLAIFDRADVRPSIPARLEGEAFIRRPADPPQTMPAADVTGYEMLGMKDIQLSYAAQFPAGHPIHSAIAALEPGNELAVRRHNQRIGLYNENGVCVGWLSRKAEAEWKDRLATIRQVRVLAMVTRTSEQDTEPDRRESHQVPEWEVPIVEVVVSP